MDDLRVGDTVLWRGGFGRDPAREAVVEGIELAEVGEKYGTPVQTAPWSRLTGRHAVISFGNYWAYAEQISRLTGQEEECGEFLERGDR